MVIRWGERRSRERRQDRGQQRKEEEVRRGGRTVAIRVEEDGQKSGEEAGQRPAEGW